MGHTAGPPPRTKPLPPPAPPCRFEPGMIMTLAPATRGGLSIVTCSYCARTYPEIPKDGVCLGCGAPVSIKRN